MSDRFEQLVKEDCCGDQVLAKAIFNATEIHLEGLYPTFSGESLKSLKVDKDKWCVPLLSIHHVTPTDMEAIWRWERTRTYNTVWST